MGSPPGFSNVLTPLPNYATPRLRPSPILPPMDLTFDLVQMVYWLLLSGWFGLVLFVAMATPVIFRTVQEADPTLPTVLSVNLDSQHAALLGMTIVGNVLARLAYVQVVCAAGLLVAIIGQWATADRSGAHLIMAVVRSALYVAASGLLVYGWRVVWPRAARERQEYVDHADEPERAEAVRAKLAKTQRESDIVQLGIATLLSALILFSGTIYRVVMTVR